MKGSVFAVAATIVSVASAQFVGVPVCAQSCISSAASGVGCALTDVGCQCASTAQIAQSAAPCILGSCTAPGDLNSAITGGAALCVAYSATAAQASATTTGSAEPTTTIVSTAHSTSTLTVASSSSMATSTSTSVSTVTPLTSDIPSPTPTTPAVVATGASSKTTTMAAATTSSAVQVPANGAGRNAAGFGALVGFLGAVLAL